MDPDYLETYEVSSNAYDSTYAELLDHEYQAWLTWLNDLPEVNRKEPD